jgi:hypothetical protein
VKRFELVLVGYAVLAGVPSSRQTLTSGVVSVYTGLSMTCMRVSDGVRAHTDVVAAAAGVGLAILALLAMASVATQLFMTSTTIKALGGRGIRPLSEHLEKLIVGLRLDGRLDVVASEGMFAFCYGMRRPRLMLSTALVDAMTDEELEAVVRHEAAHLRRWDPLRILTARALSRALAFIAIAPIVLDAYVCRRELDADREAVNAMGDVLPLASALLRMLPPVQHPRVAHLAVGALSATDVRIDQLLGHGASSPLVLTGVNRRHTFLFALVASAIVCVLISTAHAASGVRPCIPC